MTLDSGSSLFSFSNCSSLTVVSNGAASFGSCSIVGAIGGMSLIPSVSLRFDILTGDADTFIVSDFISVSGPPSHMTTSVRGVKSLAGVVVSPVIVEIHDVNGFIAKDAVGSLEVYVVLDG